MITFEAMMIGTSLEIPTFKSVKKSFIWNLKSVMGNFVNTNLLIAQQDCVLLLNMFFYHCFTLCFPVFAVYHI